MRNSTPHNNHIEEKKKIIWHARFRSWVLEVMSLARYLCATCQLHMVDDSSSFMCAFTDEYVDTYRYAFITGG